MIQHRFDIAAIRRSVNYTRKEYVMRVLWWFFTFVFYFSPRFSHQFRVFLLRVFGAKVGKRVVIYPSVNVFFPWTLTIGDDTSIGDGVTLYSLGPMRIGDRVVISQNAYLCGGTHDYESVFFTLIRAPLEVKDDCWICAGVFIGPNVTVGARSVVGAMAAVFRDCDSESIYLGNPAVRIKARVFKK